jgi:hypothetical protein
MDQIRPIGPPDRDIDPVYRVEKAHDEGSGREPEQRKKKQQPQPPADATPEGPVEGDDGHFHVDIRA